MLAVALIVLAQAGGGPTPQATDGGVSPAAETAEATPASGAKGTDAAPAAEAPAAVTPPADVPTPSAVEAPGPFAHKVDINGYASSRTTYGRSRFSGLISTADLPQWSELIELNVQLKVHYTANSFVYADVSAIGQAGFDFRTADAQGNQITAPDHNVVALNPLVSLNELYVLHEFAPWLNVMVGKKRLTWGSGQAFNPTDLLNIRKDPTDPTFQRQGAWLARVEMPLENAAFTVLFSPMVTESANGIPYGFVTYPSWDKNNDGQAHYLAAARAYFLLANTDINIMGYFSNKYLDAFENKIRVGASVSRIVFDTWEVHAEALLQQGSARVFVNGGCVQNPLAAFGCYKTATPFASQPLLDDPRYQTQALGGVRKIFDDDSFISVEYLFQSDGFSKPQFQNYINALDAIKQVQAFPGFNLNAVAGANLLIPSTSSDGTPSRFTFQPLARHYAFVTLNKPRIKDDFTAQLVLIANLQDLSTLWSPSISWSTTEWLQLSLLGFIPVPGPNGLAATVPSTGRYISEYGAFPQLFRVFFEARIFY
jgi:hypothetical protein